MRKMYKRKRRCCALCKPGKRGGAPRWSDRNAFLIREFERDRRRYEGRGR